MKIKSNRTFWWTGLPLCVAMVGLLGACGENEGKKGCEDLADSFGQGAQRCAFDYKTNYDVVYASAQCDTATSLRDSAAFYADCIPFIDDLSCADLNNPMLQVPDSCKSQINH